MGPLLPVGVPGGIISGIPGIPPGSGVVRHGAELVYLDASRYRMWRAAWAAPDRSLLLDWADRSEIAGAESLLRVLEDAWLVVELRDDHRLQAGRLALRLTGECLGNGEKASATFSVLGRLGLLRVDAAVFESLFRSDGVTPMSVICEQVDHAAPRDEVTAEDALFHALPLLIRAGVAGLNLAVR